MRDDRVGLVASAPRSHLRRLAKPLLACFALTEVTGGWLAKYTYDSRSLVTQKRLRDGQLIKLGYDALGGLVSKDVPKLAFFENDSAYGYDNLGRLTNASFPGFRGHNT